MLKIEKVDHVGSRISDNAASVAFYRELGFDCVRGRRKRHRTGPHSLLFGNDTHRSINELPKLKSPY